MDEQIEIGLHTWDVVRVQKVESDQWITNVVYRVREKKSEIDIGLEPIKRAEHVLVGDHIRCKYLDAKQEFTMLGEVTAIQVQFPQSITIRILNRQQTGNQRDANRYDVSLSSIIKPLGEDNRGTIANVRNISTGGMSFQTYMELDRLLGIQTLVEGKTRLLLETFVRPDKVLFLEGTLVRSKITEKNFEYGVRFDDTENTDGKRLIMFLYALEDEQKQMIEEQKKQIASMEE